MDGYKLSVVIPAYNEIYTLREVLRRVFARPETGEVIVVDDGSTDGTRERLRELQEHYRGAKVPLKVVFKERNEGKGSAVARGFKEATGDIVLVQDADLEYDPQDYPALIAPILEGRAEVVYGSRFLASERNVLLFWHTVANRALTLLCNVFTNLNLTDVWTGYKVFRSDIIAKVPLKSRGFNFEPEVTVKLAKLGCRITEVPVRYAGRSYAEGKKIGLKDAFIGVWTTVTTWLWGDLGELAVGERTLMVMSGAVRYNDWIRGLFAPKLGRRVIEIGSGVGNFSRFLLDRDEVVLTDTDPQYVRYLSRAYKDWGYVSVRELDILKPLSKDLEGRFDSVVCLNVVEHIHDDAAALKNLRRLLAPGGSLILIVPAHQALFGSMDERLGHFRRYERGELLERLKEAGFSAEECLYYNPIAMPGWFLNGRILRRAVIPNFQLKLFDRLTPLVRWSLSLDLPFGLSLFAVARNP